jgi:hypothetical protein
MEQSCTLSTTQAQPSRKALIEIAVGSGALRFMDQARRLGGCAGVTVASSGPTSPFSIPAD